MKYIYLNVIFCVLTLSLFADEKKIIGLMMARNEETIIASSLSALSCYVDEIIVVDDNSSDSTVAIINALKQRLPITLLCNSSSACEHKTEVHNRQILLDLGRKKGGTHFIVVDADEVFTAPCKNNNWLVQRIYSLTPGQALVLQKPHVWKSLWYYRDDQSRWSPQKSWCGCIFCDDGVSSYDNNHKDSFSGFIHMDRLPNNRHHKGSDAFIDDVNYSLIHFRFAHWENFLIKRAWYMCLELLRLNERLSVKQAKRDVRHINFFYNNIEDVSEGGIILKAVDPAWYDYPNFDVHSFEQPIVWRKNQIMQWFGQYGKSFFKDLAIWDIAWD